MQAKKQILALEKKHSSILSKAEQEAEKILTRAQKDAQELLTKAQEDVQAHILSEKAKHDALRAKTTQAILEQASSEAKQYENVTRKKVIVDRLVEGVLRV